MRLFAQSMYKSDCTAFTITTTTEDGQVWMIRQHLYLANIKPIISPNDYLFPTWSDHYDHFAYMTCFGTKQDKKMQPIQLISEFSYFPIFFFIPLVFHCMMSKYKIAICPKYPIFPFCHTTSNNIHGLAITIPRPEILHQFTFYVVCIHNALVYVFGV